MKEVKIVNRLLPNVELNPASVTSVNKLLYTGSYVVCEKLGMLKKKKRKGGREDLKHQYNDGEKI